ncbi:MAG: O-antigen ligase family protein, partial [Flavobacteriales bacterium]|nr:O-antigen ligase family protein [Flavobacteriales bacterium]
GPIMFSGKAIMFISELVLYAHMVLLLIATGGKLTMPKKLRIILIVMLAYFVFHLIYSALFLNIGNALLTSRRLVYYPFLAITAGFTTASVVKSKAFVTKVLWFMMIASAMLFMLNLAVNFNMFQEFGFISRATGVTLSAFLFGGLAELVRTGRLSKRKTVVSLVATLLVFFTSSRGVYLSMVLTVGLVLWQHRRLAGAVKVFKLVLGGIVVGTLVIVVAMNSPLVVKTLNKFSKDIANVAEGNMGSHGENFNTLGARYYLYESAFKLGLESPIFGNGSGYRVDSWHLGGSYGVNRSKTPHNYYLDIWYRLGIVGLLLFLVFYKRILDGIRDNQIQVYYMLIAALTYTCFDVLLSSNTGGILGIFLLVGASMYSSTRSES